MLNIRISLIAFGAALALAGAATAQPAQPTETGTAGTAPAAGTAESSAAQELADGEIRKVDKDNKKLTIRHGPLKSLDMPGMTMVFGVKDEAVLDTLKVGEKIRFVAEKIDGKIVATRVETAR
jgi:Cu/Ag efflux protein CusF